MTVSFESERHSGFFRNYERIKIIYDQELSEQNARNLRAELEKIPNWESDEVALKYYNGYLEKCETARALGARRIIEETRISRGLFSEDIVRRRVIDRPAPRVRVAQSKRTISDASETKDEKILKALPPALAKDEKFIRALAELGITVENGNAVFGKGIENKEKQQKFEKFLEIFNYPYSEKPTDKGLVDRYFWLLKGERDGTRFDWIDETSRRLLRMKYMEAIFDRMKSQGYTIVKSTENNRYEVFCINPGKRDEIKQTTYSRLVKGEKGDFSQANQEDLDFGITWAVVTGRRDIMNKGSTETSIIKGILEANVIKSPSGEKIIDEKTLLLHKDFVLRQVNEKMQIDTSKPKAGKKDGTEAPVAGQFAVNIQEYQELAFLRDWIVGERHLTPNIVNNTTDLVNQYRNYKYLTAFVGSKINDLNPGSKEFGTQLQELAGTLALPGIAVILFAWLTGNGKLALGGAAALFGLYAGGEVLNRTGLGNKVSETLGVLRITDGKNVNPITADSLEAPAKISAEYKKSLELLANLNKQNKTKADSGSLAPYVKNNFVLGKILFEIERSGKNWQLEDVNTPEAVWKAIEANATITGSEFTDFPGSVKGTKITKKDVESVLEMMKDPVFIGAKAAKPRTILDALSESGKDVTTSTYDQFFSKSLVITGNADFDASINDELRRRFDGKPVKTKREIIELRNLLLNGLNKDIFVLSNWTSVSNLSKMFEGQKAEIARLQSLKDELKQRNFPSDIIAIVDDYKAYTEISGKLSAYEGFFSKQSFTDAELVGRQVQVMFLSGVEVISGGTLAGKTLEEQKKYFEDLRDGVIASKQELENIAIGSSPLFNGVAQRKTKALSDFDRLIASIDTKAAKVQLEIDSLFGAAPSGTVNDAEKAAIFNRLKTSPSTEIQLIKKKEKEIDDLNFDGDIAAITASIKKISKELGDLGAGYASGDASTLDANGERVMQYLTDPVNVKLNNAKTRLARKVESYLGANEGAIQTIDDIIIPASSAPNFQAVLSQAFAALTSVKSHIEKRSQNTLIDWVTPSISIGSITIPSIPLKLEGSLGTVSDTALVTEVELITGETLDNRDLTIDALRSKYNAKLSEVTNAAKSSIESLDITTVDVGNIDRTITLILGIKKILPSGTDTTRIDQKLSEAREKLLNSLVSDIPAAKVLLDGVDGIVRFVERGGTEPTRAEHAAELKTPTLTLRRLNDLNKLYNHPRTTNYLKSLNLN